MNKLLENVIELERNEENILCHGELILKGHLPFGHAMQTLIEYCKENKCDLPYTTYMYEHTYAKYKVEEDGHEEDNVELILLKQEEPESFAVTVVRCK